MTDLVTLGELRTWAGVNDAGADTGLQRALTSASRWVEAHCGWQFSLDAVATARVFIAEHQSVLTLPPGSPISTTSGLIVEVDQTGSGTYSTLTIGTDFTAPIPFGVDGTQWPITELYTTLGQFWLFGRGRNNGLVPTVRVTAKWGWPAMPEVPKQACLILAVDLWQSRNPGAQAHNSFAQGAGARSTAECMLDSWRHGNAVVGIA